MRASWEMGSDLHRLGLNGVANSSPCDSLSRRARLSRRYPTAESYRRRKGLWSSPSGPDLALVPSFNGSHLCSVSPMREEIDQEHEQARIDIIKPRPCTADCQEETHQRRGSDDQDDCACGQSTLNWECSCVLVQAPDPMNGNDRQ